MSAAGTASVEVANPNAYALRGKATVTAGGRAIATRAVRLARRSVTTVRLRLGANGLATLRAAGGRATITLRLRRSGGRATTARRTLTLRAPSGEPSGAPEAPPTPPAPPADGGQLPGGQQSGGTSNDTAPPPPASNTWVGRMGNEGEYDDLELTVVDGQMQVTKAPFVPVSCFENGGCYRSALSLELFDAPGPWTIGTDANVAKQGIAVNQLVSGGARTITYKVSGTTQDAGRIAGTLGMSFVDSKYDVFTNTITFINCAGSQSFEAVPGTLT